MRLARTLETECRALFPHENLGESAPIRTCYQAEYFPKPGASSFPHRSVQTQAYTSECNEPLRSTARQSYTCPKCVVPGLWVQDPCYKAGSIEVSSTTEYPKAQELMQRGLVPGSCATLR